MQSGSGSIPEAGVVVGFCVLGMGLGLPVGGLVAVVLGGGAVGFGVVAEPPDCVVLAGRSHSGCK